MADPTPLDGMLDNLVVTLHERRDWGPCDLHKQLHALALIVQDTRRKPVSASDLAEAQRELDRWRNCFICPDCGRGAADEDGCCTTCGRDVLGFVDGKLVRPLPDVPDPQLTESHTAEAIAAWMLDMRFDKPGREAEWSRFLAAQISSGAWRAK